MCMNSLMKLQMFLSLLRCICFFSVDFLLLFVSLLLIQLINMSIKLTITTCELNKLTQRSRAINLVQRRAISRKVNRNQGLAYVSKNGNQLPVKEGPEAVSCNCVRPGCRLSLEDKQKIFQFYYSTRSYEEKTIYLASLMEKSGHNMGAHGCYAYA